MQGRLPCVPYNTILFVGGDSIHQFKKDVNGMSNAGNCINCTETGSVLNLLLREKEHCAFSNSWTLSLVMLQILGLCNRTKFRPLRKIAQCCAGRKTCSGGPEQRLAERAGQDSVACNGGGEQLMTDLSAVETRDLVRELSRRDGVETHTIGPSASIKVKADGPCIVFVIID